MELIISMGEAKSLIELIISMGEAKSLIEPVVFLIAVVALWAVPRLSAHRELWVVCQLQKWAVKPRKLQACALPETQMSVPHPQGTYRPPAQAGSTFNTSSTDGPQSGDVIP